MRKIPHLLNCEFIQCLYFAVDTHVFLFDYSNFLLGKINDFCKQFRKAKLTILINQPQRMKVFKFGGASINTIERIQNTGEILRSFQGEKILVVISAMGKTTNALEKVTDAFYNGKKEEALKLFELV